MDRGFYRLGRSMRLGLPLETAAGEAVEAEAVEAEAVAAVEAVVATHQQRQRET